MQPCTARTRHILSRPARFVLHQIDVSMSSPLITGGLKARPSSMAPTQDDEDMAIAAKLAEHRAGPAIRDRIVSAVRVFFCALLRTLT
jgi:hypothetical protein